MGVDCRITLPENVRVHNVANVVGVLAGLKPEKRYFPDDINKGWATSVPGVRVMNSTCPELADIALEGEMVDGNTGHTLYYHFESDNGGRLLCPRSTAFWIAVGKRLVDFFGGTVDYQDCDEKQVDYHRKKKTRLENSPTDGNAWYRLQNKIMNLQAITQMELEQAEAKAAYKTRKKPCESH